MSISQFHLRQEKIVFDDVFRETIMEIVIKDHIGDRATDMKQGEQICSLIAEAFSKGQDVTLNFADMTTILSAFLNTAVGNLYKSFTSSYLNAHLKVVNICDGDLFLLKCVTRMAKEYEYIPVFFPREYEGQ